MANQKITELTAIDAIATTDVFPLVDDIGGTPTTKKATGTQVREFVIGNQIVIPSIINPGGGIANQAGIVFEMPTGTGFAKTSPFQIINNATYFAGDGGVSPDQPFAMGRIPTNANAGDPTYSIASWVHEVDYNPGGPYTAHERYDVVRGAGPGSDTYWDYPSGDYLDSRRIGYAYEVFSNNFGDSTRGTVGLSIIGDGLLFTSNFHNPDNPSIGELGQFAGLAPNFETGEVTWRIGTTETVEYLTQVLSDKVRIASSGGYRTEFTGELVFIEDEGSLQFTINSAGDDRISLYANGTGKSVRIGGASRYSIQYQDYLEHTTDVYLAYGYKIVSNTLSLFNHGSILDLYNDSPNKAKIYSDLNRVYVHAANSGGTSEVALAASAYERTVVVANNYKIGWASDTSPYGPVDKGFRVNSGVIEAIDASNAPTKFKVGLLDIGAYTIASLPAAASHAGSFAIATDSTPANLLVQASGGAWRYVHDNSAV